MQRQDLELLMRRDMPFGKYKGRKIAELPGHYLNWFAREGFPPGEIGRLLALMQEIDHNGLRPLLEPLRGKCPMKIHQLPMGARFEYEGIEYVKTGPMFANGPAGQRMIPKYAVLKPLDFVAPTLPEPSALLPRAAVLAAFDTFHAQCSALVPPDQRDALDKARLVFLQSLDGQ